MDRCRLRSLEILNFDSLDFVVGEVPVGSDFNELATLGESVNQLHQKPGLKALRST
jgi:hypothetical protein